MTADIRIPASSPAAEPIILLGPDEHFREKHVPGHQTVRALREQFPDGEQLVYVPEAERLAGRRVLVVQRTSAGQDSALMTLLQLLDVARGAGPAELACFPPYLCYQRQDRACREGEPVTAGLVVRMLAAAGAQSVVCVDRHGRAPSGPGLPRLLELSCAASFAAGPAGSGAAPDLVLAPDEGARRRASAAAEALGVPLVCLDKSKDAARGTGFSALPAGMAGQRALVVEDLCSTGSTLVPLHERLLEAGIRPMYFVTHLLADPGLIRSRLRGAEGVYFSDSCGHPDAALRVLPMALDAWTAGFAA